MWIARDDLDAQRELIDPDGNRVVLVPRGQAGIEGVALTIQVFDCPGEHARILEAGGVEGLAPRQIGEVAYISMVRDPDDNWIEISQRASLTGALPGS
jgi:catechol 2,3-dioxygenase-like lactoylglutathione lyase family enzyme